MCVCVHRRVLTNQLSHLPLLFLVVTNSEREYTLLLFVSSVAFYVVVAVLVIVGVCR